MHSSIRTVAVLFALTCAGCGGEFADLEEQPDSTQADVFEKLKAKEVNVSLDAEGKIVAVELEGESLGDDAVALLKEIPTLKRVNLQGSGVTDAGLAHLQGIQTLEYVNLEETGVSRSAAQKLRTALPNCQVSHGSGDDEGDGDG